MTRQEKARQILIAHQEWRKGGDGEPTNPQALSSAIDVAIEQLGRADITPEDAEEALDKFCNTQEPPDAMTILTIQRALQTFTD